MEGDGNMNGVCTELFATKQELDCRFKLTCEEENLLAEEITNKTN